MLCFNNCAFKTLLLNTITVKQKRGLSPHYTKKQKAEEHLNIQQQGYKHRMEYYAAAKNSVK